MVVNTQSKLTKNFPANRYFKKSGIQSSPNPSFNPDAASTGNFLLHILGFLVSSRRAAVGTAG